MRQSEDPETSDNLASATPEKEITFLGRVVSPDDYREMCLNLAEFIKLLRKWNEEANSK